ncbi:MAG: flagellar hook-basal body complex protein [Alphaproteobacteria bacterium]|nr:flagellar hook-basal body complex protein [Alphaproteobacteria bacterium]MBU0793288.1 flagellar hook-basal body complex protein [Alphaproteobacteria bacterium]MBU0876253.1 flagellar hook-basal body complex protein [Alphaproteobacteria bacterium]MBU1768178.1 flagellar hook-basal body complex protein [Alphaproteobacteria bacterium]
MSFYISLSGLKGAQTDLGVVANNVANVSSLAFKKSKATFGDIYASGGVGAGGNGVRLVDVKQQFTQGTLETTDKTLDLAVTGEGFFTVKSASPDQTISYTRAGAFTMDKNRFITDTTGARLQVLPTDPVGDGTPTSTAAADLSDLVIPSVHPDDATIPLTAVSISATGVVSATFGDGSVRNLGVVAMATFPAQEELRQMGDSHWISSGDSGEAAYSAANSGMVGAVRSGTLERSNVDITEELVALISAQRNFQANSKAIETATAMTQTIINMRT